MAVESDDVVTLCSDLLRIDTSNYGPGGGGPGERAAAEYVAGKLDEVGIASDIYESEKGRTSLVARWEGADASRDALLIHTHLDTVPANANDWKVDPFSGELADGCLWGRGAVDMKDMVAMTLATVRSYAASGRKPARDVVLAFLADEEAGGALGAHWMVDNHADLFAGCTEAIGEVGGFSVTVRDDLRLYLVETAQKGIGWMKLTARGRAGHGSMVNNANAITFLAEAVARIGTFQWPTVLTDTVRQLLDELSAAYGVELDLDDPTGLVAKLGGASIIVGATLRNSAAPTMLGGGYKANVIPQTATATIDGRFLPGQRAAFEAQIDELLGPHVTREYEHFDEAVETTFDGALVEAMKGAISAEDPQSRTIPYCLSGGTDAKSFSPLGIRCFGFSPLQLPPDLDFSGMFHGIDERVPVESLLFGQRVLERFVTLA